MDINISGYVNNIIIEFIKLRFVYKKRRVFLHFYLNTVLNVNEAVAKRSSEKHCEIEQLKRIMTSNS